MKTDHSHDNNQTYNPLDVVLVRTPGIKAWFKRLFTLSDWDDCWICLEWDREVHLCQVVNGRLMYGPNRSEWGGYMKTGGLKCKIIRFQEKIGSETKAKSFVGQRFKNTPNCISHIFGLPDSSRASIESLLIDSIKT